MDFVIQCFSWLPCFPKPPLTANSTNQVASPLSREDITQNKISGPGPRLSTPEKKNGFVFPGSETIQKRARDLYDACWDGDLLGCVELLDKGANPNMPFGPRHATALHAAVKTKNLSVSFND